MKRPTVSSSVIVKAIESKHSKDVFVAECKNGPSQSGSHARVDAWSMCRSWAHPCVTAYEVKVSRSDFLGDKKWRAYLPMCNELLFAAPKGLISLDELPAEVGLIELVGESRLVTRRKAVYRDIVIAQDVFRYILMCRTQIYDECRIEQGESRADRWRQWLACQKEEQKLGYEVSRAVRDHVNRVESESRRLKTQMESYDELKAFLDSHGIVSSRYNSKWDLEARMNEIKTGVPREVEASVQKAVHALRDLSAKLGIELK